MVDDTPSDAKPNGSNGHVPDPFNLLRHAKAADPSSFRTASGSILLDRLQFARQAGITFNGDRDMYAVLGYDRVVTAKQYRDEYARGGIAKRVVEAFPKATWRGGVEVFEDEDPEVITPFEQAFADMDAKFHVWQRLMQADILAGLSTYSVLLIGATGQLETELPKGGKLIGIWPFSGGGGPTGLGTQSGDSNYVDASIMEFETDARNERFGLPKMYQLKRTDFTSPQLATPVHWSRIIHVAEGTLANDVYGTPVLENVWNLLIDLMKVTGGGAEAFWLRANAGLHLNVDPELELSETEKQNLRDQADEYQHQLRRMMRTRGVDINQLGSDVANFSAPADAILKQIAGSKGIPLRILTGSEMGELASTQDAGNWQTQVQDRRTSYADPCMVRRLVDRLIDYGYLPKPKQYEMGWPLEADLSEPEKATLAVSLATVNQAQGSIVFTDEEIRDMTFDMQPLSANDKKKAAEEQGALAQAKNPVPPPGAEDVVPAKKGPFGRPLKAAGGYDESQHPRDKQGEWTDSTADDGHVAMTGPHLGLLAPDGTDHVADNEDHTDIARRVLDNPDGGVREALAKGYVRYWVRRDEVALNFQAGNERAAHNAMQLLKDFHTAGNRIYADIEPVRGLIPGRAMVLDLPKFFDNIRDANRVIREAGQLSPEKQKGLLKAAEAEAEPDEMLAVLEAAIEANHTDVIDRILGLSR